MSASRTYLLRSCDLVRERVRAAVAIRQTDDPDPEDRFRGLYISDEQATQIFEERPPLVEPVESTGAAELAASAASIQSAESTRPTASTQFVESIRPAESTETTGSTTSTQSAGAAGAAASIASVDKPMSEAVEREELNKWADEKERNGEVIGLRSLMRSFDLTQLDVDILLITLGPDIDPRLERAYGYLHDDVTRRRASTGLTLELCGQDPFNAVARKRLGASGPLIRHGLVVVEDSDRPFLTRSLRVPDPVTSHLIGDDTPDPLIAPLLTHAVMDGGFDTTVVERAFKAGINLFYIRDRIGAASLSFASSGAAASGFSATTLDLSGIDSTDDVAAIATAASRHALMTNSVLVINPVEILAQRGPFAVKAFTEAGANVMLIGTETWDPMWSRTPPLVVDAPDVDRRLIVGGLPFRLTPEQVETAHHAAEKLALAEGSDTTDSHLAAGARAQNAGGLERLALRIAPSVGWDDIVVPTAVSAQLHELVDRVRYSDRVLNQWGLRREATRGRGVTGLFAGDSGTGKTLAAEVVSAELGLDLYVIDLSTVVDKYIGETEKNLDRIFREADRVNGVLLFDEADAIFGKRSEVQDARDRYANLEVAYLLQRVERFDGVALLTTNLRANIDEAFLRRLDVLVDFPTPDAQMRHMLWNQHLPEHMPRDETVDIDFLSERFDLSGGNIRNIALSAAFLAAASNNVLTMNALISATAREYRKLGRLCVPTEFGPYYQLL